MRWVSNVSEIAYQPTANIQLWLTKPYILSHALKRVCKHFTLQLLAQGFAEAPLDDKTLIESYYIQSSGFLCFVREVQLLGDGLPLTYGRVTIPDETYHRHYDLFSTLDDKPIGEKMLYGNPDVRRSAFEYAFLPEKNRWGRRSVFFIKEDPLLITELIEPTIPAYVSEDL